MIHSNSEINLIKNKELTTKLPLNSLFAYPENYFALLAYSYFNVYTICLTYLNICHLLIEVSKVILYFHLLLLWFLLLYYF